MMMTHPIIGDGGSPMKPVAQADGGGKAGPVVPDAHDLPDAKSFMKPASAWHPSTGIAL